MKKISSGITHQDDRGVIMDLIEGARINAITYISFAKGAIRGNHFHRKTTQWNYVLKGRIRLVSQVGDGPITETVLRKGELAVTNPREKHALVGLVNSEMLVFTAGPRSGKDYESDTYRLEKGLV